LLVHALSSIVSARPNQQTAAAFFATFPDVFLAIALTPIRRRLARCATGWHMAVRRIHVFQFNGQLETLIRKGKSPARRVLKARILLKADVSEAGKGWSDNRIISSGLSR
jgi:hypothetical protein